MIRFGCKINYYKCCLIISQLISRLKILTLQFNQRQLQNRRLYQTAVEIYTIIFLICICLYERSGQIINNLQTYECQTTIELLGFHLKCKCQIFFGQKVIKPSRNDQIIKIKKVKIKKYILFLKILIDLFYYKLIIHYVIIIRIKLQLKICWLIKSKQNRYRKMLLRLLQQVNLITRIATIQ